MNQHNSTRAVVLEKPEQLGLHDLDLAEPHDDQDEDTGEYLSHGTASSILFAETQTIPKDSEALEPFAKGQAG